MNWPLTERDLQALLSRDEDERFERKQAWYDLDRPLPKAEMVKDILALANCAGKDRPSILLAGVEDLRRGGKIIGINAELDKDRITQILQAYSAPLPEICIQHAMLDGNRVAAIGIFWTEQHPYYATRDFEKVLSSSVFYTRRGGITGHMTPPEIEHAIRAKGARVGAPRIGAPLSLGFVEVGKWLGPYGPIVRFQNVSDAPIAEIQLVFDVQLARDRQSFYRRRTFDGLTLAPGESRESELELRYVRFSGVGGDIDLWNGSIWDRWLDVRARLRYRDAAGFFQEVEATTFVVD